MKTNKSILRRLYVMACILVMAATTMLAQTTDNALTVKEKNGKVGLVFNEGNKNETILPCNYDLIHDYGNGLFAVQRNGKFGLIFCSVSRQYGVAAAGMVWLLPCNFEKYGIIKIGNPQSTFAVKVNGKWGIITGNHGEYGEKTENKDGWKTNLECEYDSIVGSDLHSDIVVEDSYFFATIMKDGKWGAIIMSVNSTKPDYELPCEYDDISYLSDGKELNIGYKVTKGNKCGLVSKDYFKVLIPCEYDSFPTYFQIGLGVFLEVETNGKIGIYSLNMGKLIIPPGDYASGSEETFKDRITLTRVDGSKASFDLNGNKVNAIWGQRVDAQHFNKMGSGEFFYVSKATSGPYTAIVNKNDKVIVNLANTKIVGYNETQNVWYAKRNGKIGAINGKTGGIIAPFAFNGTVGPYSGNGNVCVYKDGTPKITYYIYSPSGKLIIQKAFTTSQKLQRERFFQDYL